MLELHNQYMEMIVLASVQWMELNDAINSSGLFFPVDPGSSTKWGVWLAHCVPALLASVMEL